MRPKFLADENLRRSIPLGVRLREPSVDFLTARECGTLGLSDPAILAIHSREGRVLVSSDSDTMVGFFYDLVETGTFCPGLIIIPQDLPDGEAIDELLMIWSASRPDDLSNQVAWLPL